MEAVKTVNVEIGILSLSKNWDNPLMWAHYSDSHKGFILGFDSTHQFFNDYLSKDEKESKYLKDVIYADERVKIPSKLDEPKLMFEAFLTKSTDWQYEQEVRLLSTLNLSHKKEQIDNHDIYTIKVPHTALVEINISLGITSLLFNQLQQLRALPFGV